MGYTIKATRNCHFYLGCAGNLSQLCASESQHKSSLAQSYGPQKHPERYLSYLPITRTPPLQRCCLFRNSHSLSAPPLLPQCLPLQRRSPRLVHALPLTSMIVSVVSTILATRTYQTHEFCPRPVATVERDVPVIAA